jgi:hypothetical protein
MNFGSENTNLMLVSLYFLPFKRYKQKIKLCKTITVIRKTFFLQKKHTKRFFLRPRIRNRSLFRDSTLYFLLILIFIIFSKYFVLLGNILFKNLATKND